MAVNNFDYQIVHYLNQFCRRSELFDKAMVVVVNNTLLKGGLMMLVFWYEWFLVPKDKFTKNQQTIRLQIISALSGCCVSMFTVRVLTRILPFRARPILNPDNHLLAAFGLNTNLVDNTNSFPSDHASLFFGLAMGLFFLSWRLGLLSFLYVTVVVVFPRIYLGWHYPSDIAGGAVMGIFFVSLANMAFFKRTVSERILSFADVHPQLFYPFFFLLTYQIATLFEGVRTLASFVFHPYTAVV